MGSTHFELTGLIMDHKTRNQVKYMGCARYPPAPVAGLTEHWDNLQIPTGRAPGDLTGVLVAYVVAQHAAKPFCIHIVAIHEAALASRVAVLTSIVVLDPIAIAPC